MKYQLAIHWKDGNASGRVIDIDWPLTQPLGNVASVTIKPYRPVPAPHSGPRSKRPPDIDHGRSFKKQLT